MDRRYQVFISSTFRDLVEERREIMQALLEMDCLPAGMELFPASNESQWTLIQGVIDASDYYLVVLGGRYGSETEEGISYTEKEYDYAVQAGIPVMGFVPANPDSIPAGKTDKNDAAAQKLAEFQAKVQNRMTKEWSSPEDLGSKVTRGMINLIKTNPRPGWVRGTEAMTPETRAEIAELRAQIAQQEKRDVEGSIITAAEIDKAFAHGDEEIAIEVNHRGYEGYKPYYEDGNISYSWNEVVEAIGPFMLDEAPEPLIRNALESDVLRSIQESPEIWTTTWSSQTAAISDSSWGSIIVQLRALRIIQTGTKKRTVSDKAVYWKLTPAGDDYLVGLRAVSHDPDFRKASD
ncbi:DUF4062 domain-containing protein [Frigoribacterium sp. MCBA15_019]|uniref:DUF4062 domain-containing protein n=1 Tax=Frigoribacterium sp. MCBA15_019 TaxID=1898745 RepID=UPI0009F4FA73|nr:DUF4062 domain-containing protein [Frigoribacterium sp. MCBA15_019]